MTDNWSLKGKESYVYMDDLQGFDETSDEELEEIGVKTIYFRQDIETLRQKLIEDVQGLCDDRIGKAITSIINRRFGVEEENHATQ